MATARSTGKLVSYIPLGDRALPTDQQTTFLLRQVPAGALLALTELKQDDLSGVLETARRFVRAVLAGWKNFRGEDGQEAPHKTGFLKVGTCTVRDAATEATIDRIDPELFNELFREALAVNGMVIDWSKAEAELTGGGQA